jgi:hypothetical protein
VHSQTERNLVRHLGNKFIAGKNINTRLPYDFTRTNLKKEKRPKKEIEKDG